MNIYEYNNRMREEYLKNKTPEALSRYVASELISPIEDYINAINIIRNAPAEIRDFNILAVGAFISALYDCEKHNDLLDILNSNIPDFTPYELSIVWYLNANDLMFKDRNYIKNPQYEKYLLKSIEHDCGFVYNYIRLAELYKGDKGTAYYQKALDNIICVKSYEDIQKSFSYEFFDLNCYINEDILGTHITYVVYEIFIEEYSKLKSNDIY